LTFSDSIITDNEAINTGFYPVTSALKITGTLNVQPEIFLSYANANFTGIASSSDAFDLKMYYKATDETQFEVITLAAITETDFIDIGDKTIKSKNSGDVGTASGAGILSPGGFVGITDYQGEYVLALGTEIGGGGGGGLVSPGLVVNALAGLGGIGGGGSGGSAPLTSINQLISSTVVDLPEEVKQMIENHDSSIPILPMDPNSFENFDFPLVINDQGFVLGGFTSTLQTQTIKPNTPVTMKFMIYESETIQHFSIYMNLRGANDSIRTSDTQILYNDGKELQVIDKNGFLSNAKITVIEGEEDFKKHVIVEMTFAKEMETSHIITRSWDPNLFSRDTHILNAIKVGSPEPEFVPTVKVFVNIPELTADSIRVSELASTVAVIKSTADDVTLAFTSVTVTVAVCPVVYIVLSRDTDASGTSSAIPSLVIVLKLIVIGDVILVLVAEVAKLSVIRKTVKDDKRITETSIDTSLNNCLVIYYNHTRGLIDFIIFLANL